jgi:glycosyltransferase involved in cell wall biosynthesis
MSNKIKVLAYQDSPTSATGFSTVSRNILTGLYNTGRYHIDILGINYWGDPHNFPFRIWPTGTGSKDPYGRQKVFNMIPQMEFDLLFFLQDTFILNFLPDLHTRLRNDGREFRSICYYPVDGQPKSQWIANVNACDYLVAYSEFGKKRSINALPNMKDPMVIPHGANTKDYFVVDEKTVGDFRKQFFGPQADKFIFTNVNRNQQRKDIPRTIAAFKEFRKHVPDSVLLLHMAEKDQGWNLPKVVEANGLSTSTDVIFPKNFGPNQGYPRHVVNLIYNASDCLLSTTLGEGFGLCLLPETNVYTDSGVKMMKELTVSDKVLSSNSEYNDIEGIMTRDHSGDIYKITTWMSNIPLGSSPEHGFMVYSNGDRMWKKASDLSVGDCLLFPKKYNESTVEEIDVLSLIDPVINRRQRSNIVSENGYFKIQSNFKKEENLVPAKIKITEDLCKLFGLYLAEGSINSAKKDCIKFSFHKKETDLISFVEDTMKDVFGLDLHHAHEDSRENYNGKSIIFILLL